MDSVADLEKKLEEAGYGIGQRMTELIGVREKSTKRETRLVNMLQYVTNVVWKHLFNKSADNLERSMENEDECKNNILIIFMYLILYLYYISIFYIYILMKI